ncbi:uncharacterized protein LOC113003548 isoform X2 [Solenopsis invicta]|uniref:uncharacterized protein LOC113003548 isoform X2 n=1 Tax=Solenopsis invicta TaxID=13686 RepID=UPI00193E0BD2|nr:uncharacterized protein LOC113003548 isoform X2 [Solenopsis invicta]
MVQIIHTPLLLITTRNNIKILLGVSILFSILYKMEKYVIVTDEIGGRILNENGLTLLQNVAEEMSTTDESCQSSSFEHNSTDEKNSKWTHDATVALIYEYKNKMSMFQSSTIRNEAVWKIISTNLGQKNFYYTPKQCEFKFKNLKKKYTAKVDNMKATASGAAVIKFEYFDVFNEMLGRKPNVVPLATASSSRGQGIALDTDLNVENILQADDIENNKENIEIKQRSFEEEAPKKNIPQKTKFEQMFVQLHNINNKREEAKYIRHKELIVVQENAIKVFSEKMDQLIDKL